MKVNMVKYSSVESMIKSISKYHGDTYSYELITSYVPEEPLSIICKTHGIFKLTAQSHRIGYGCVECQKQDKDIFNKLYKPKTDRFICKAIDKHGDKYDYSNTIVDSTSFVKIVCKQHGEFSQRYFDHLHGFNCPTCGAISIRTKLMQTQDEFTKKANIIHKFKYDYSKIIYNGNSAKIEIICPKHGNFWQTPDNHINNKSGCPKCKSKWKSQDLWLDCIGIPNDQDHRQVRLKNDGITNGRKKFVVDGYDPSTNTIYEYLGDYHHGNPEIYSNSEIHCYNKKPLGEIYLQTIAKLEYLFNKGFNIIYIWENQFINNKCDGHIFNPSHPIIYT